MSDDQTPPSNVPFEKRVLGAALMNEDALVLVVQSMRVDDFYAVAHQSVFEMIAAAASEGAVDPTLIARALDRANAIGVDDAYALIDDLTSNPAPVSVLDGYITDVRSCAQARGLRDLGRALMESANASAGDPDAVLGALSAADDSLQKVTEEVAGVPWASMDDLASRVMSPEQEAAARIVPTGFADLDKMLMGGLRTKQLIVLAARPAQGKSTIAMDVARHASVYGNIPGLVVSLEMPQEELAMRAMAAEARVPLSTIQTGDGVSERDSARLTKAAEKIQGAPLYVVDQIEPTLPALRGLLIAAKRRLDVQYVVVDYLQLMQSDGTKNPSREQQVANISRTMKSLARNLDIAIIAVAQLNRGPEQRVDHKPQMSDLRESGQLEQDGDMVWLLHRPDFYDPESVRAGEADLIVAKHRNGKTGTVPLAFQGHYARFADMARTDEYQEA